MTLQGELNIAVLIYGRLKKANDSFSHIKNSLKKYNNINFFLSTDNANSNEIEQFIKNTIQKFLIIHLRILIMKAIN